MLLVMYGCFFQRDNVYVWDMSGSVPTFSLKGDIRGLELPKGTILEIEIVHELKGEVGLDN